METIGDLLGRERRSSASALRAPAGRRARGEGRGAGAATADYSYHDLVTAAWQTAGLFRQRGVHEGATVAVVDDAAVPAVLSLLGAAQLGALTLFDPPPEPDTDVLFGPAETVLSYNLPPGGVRVAYGGGPTVEEPSVVPFGRHVTAETPVEPPESVAPDAPALATDGSTLTQAALLEAAGAAGETLDLDGAATVTVRAPLSAPGAVVGLLAAFGAEATAVLAGPRAGEEGGPGADARAGTDEGAGVLVAADGDGERTVGVGEVAP